MAILQIIRRKAAQFIGFLSRPDDFRLYLCNRFPRISPTSFVLWWLYPAWWKYLLYLCSFRFQQENRIQMPGRHNRFLIRVPSPAGIGDQIVTAWSETYLLARQFNLIFVHHPFLRNPHSPEVDWENFLLFGDDEVQADDVLHNQAIKTVYLPPMKLTSFSRQLVLSRMVRIVYPQEGILFHLGSRLYLESKIDQSELMPAIYRQKYWRARSCRPLANYFEIDCINIAVHIRRGDVVALKDIDKTQWANRWIDNSYYINALTELTRLLVLIPFKIHIYSDGKREELAELACFPNIVFHLDEDPTASFHGMINADILIVSSSAFAICAGKISSNLKLVSKGFDKPEFRLFIPTSESWVEIEPSGHFSDVARLQITEMLSQAISTHLLVCEPQKNPGERIGIYDNVWH